MTFCSNISSCINQVQMFYLPSDAGRWKTWGVPVVIGGDNLPSPVGKGLTDLPNIGGGHWPPWPPAPVSASLSHVHASWFIGRCLDKIILKQDIGWNYFLIILICSQVLSQYISLTNSWRTPARPLMNSCLPDGLLPDGLLPDGLLPDRLLPDGLLPDGLLTDGLLPDRLLPDGLLPDRLLTNSWPPPPDPRIYKGRIDGDSYYTI